MDGFSGIADSIKEEDALMMQDKFRDTMKLLVQLENLDSSSSTRLLMQAHLPKTPRFYQTFVKNFSIGVSSSPMKNSGHMLKAYKKNRSTKTKTRRKRIKNN